MRANPDIIRLRPVAQIVYEEQLPSELPGVKESITRGDDTLARVEKMKLEAALKGMLVTFGIHVNDPESRKFFEEPVRQRKEGLPSLKLSEVISTGNLARQAALK